MKKPYKKDIPNYKSENTMQINDAECWNCGKKMKMALILSEVSFFGPEEFNERQIEFARTKGVIIKQQFSKTLESSYLANTCPDCNSFIGQLFIDDYMDSPGERYKLDF